MNYSNSTINTFKLLLPFLWPQSRSDLRLRVILALICLVLAKIANVYTPLILGKLVDSLSALSNQSNDIMLIPLALIIAYGISRIN